MHDVSIVEIYQHVVLEVDLLLSELYCKRSVDLISELLILVFLLGVNLAQIVIFELEETLLKAPAINFWRYVNHAFFKLALLDLTILDRNIGLDFVVTHEYQGQFILENCILLDHIVVVLNIDQAVIVIENIPSLDVVQNQCGHYPVFDSLVSS